MNGIVNQRALSECLQSLAELVSLAANVTYPYFSAYIQTTTGVRRIFDQTVKLYHIPSKQNNITDKLRVYKLENFWT